jgi:heptosyltransferase-2
MKVLIIRFSSFGDIVQCMPVLPILHARWPQVEIDWVVRADFADLLAPHPHLHRLWRFDRQHGLKALWSLSGELAAQHYTHIYDAHNNLRSRLLITFLRVRRGLGQCSRFHLLRRGKNRLKRWLLFRWRIALLPTPFIGQHSFIEPLSRWGASSAQPPAPTFFLDPQAQSPVSLPLHFVALVPSAAWALKRWPVAYWQELIASLKKTNFVLLGGREDTFCEDLRQIAPERVTNLAGRATLAESCVVLSRAQAVVANDTGLLHVADSLGRPLLALIGPTAFGYPAQPSSATLETHLACKPCSKDGRGRCRNPEYQKCLKDLSPAMVQKWLEQTLRSAT